MPDPIRVILVDDQSLVRSGFRMLIESEDDMEVVSEASNGLEALDVLRRMPVDVALMDIRMPQMGRCRGHSTHHGVPTGYQGADSDHL